MVKASMTGTDQTASVADLLTDLIRDQKLAIGEKLPPIRELAKLFDVKTGAVRDALLDAQGRGLVRLLPRAGAFVQALSADPCQGPTAKRTATRLRERLAKQNQNLLHVLEVRQAIELETISKASRRCELADLFSLRQTLETMASLPLDARGADYVQLDIQFHLEIARLCGNTVMTSILGTLMEELEPYLVRVPWSKERHHMTDQSHARLYSALVQGDADTAKVEMQVHIREAFDSLLNELKEPPAMLSHNRSQ